MNYTNHKEHCTHEHHHKKDCHCGKDHSLISEKSQQDRCEREEACEDTLEEPLDQSHSCACHHNHEDHHHHHHEGCQCTGNHTETKSEKILQKAKYKFKINKLDCANCAMKVEDAIAKQAYINDVSLSFSTSILMVDTQREDKQQLLKDLNMIANQVEEKVVIETYQKSEVKIANHRQEIFQLIAGFIALFISMLVEEKMGQITTWLYLFTYLIVGYKVLFIAFRNLLKRDLFDENFLMSLATIGAFALGDYKEAVAVMLFYDIGELFQSIAVNRSRRSIGDLMNIHSDYAMVIRDGKEVAVDPDTLLVDDIVVVKAGERICVDGIVIEGESSLDTSALTGESLPKEISVNDEVLAGCLNINGLFKMRVVKVASESTVSRVLELVENAASKKAKIEKFITKFSKIYTPTVVFAAACLIIIPTLIQGYASFGTWLYRGCTFLVISCPCALVISIPLGLFAGIGAASKKGVLIKGGNYLELLSEIDTIVFDKTGTITKGSFRVVKVEGTQDVLKLAAYGESYSNHPIAMSIVNAYANEIIQDKLSAYQEIAGQGIKAMFEGKTLLVGNAKLLQEQGITFKESVDLGSIIYVAYDGIYQGYIVISDEIKETSLSAIQALKQLGVQKTVMLSGDKKQIAQSVADKIGIDEVHAQLLPQDKVAVLESYLTQEKHKVAFVGDGINDAPVLMRSDIGIAMGAIGSDAAIEASDIVLMNDDLSSISSAIRIARKTKSILYQNIVFSLLVKFVVLLLTSFGLANMWMGVFADVGVTLIAIINAMRALKVK